ncbi:CLUMA_CG011163, isoform A [Clunio marinus]|uniref:CLUMA_CG011163, isoform A n=1 Tax=Clunio marinus TaxID=568069 RepID=A0A1J1IC23_9DIPT|nr:CLUMA_CG011163, isoform A [Clunio marinus]
MRIHQSLRQQILLKVGDFVKETKIVSQKDLDKFAAITGDFNPIHNSDKSIVHGAFLNGLTAGIIGTKLPGPGTILLSQNLKFPSKCYVNDPIEITVELMEVRKIIKAKYKCEQNGIVVFLGEANLIMDKEANK